MRDPLSRLFSSQQSSRDSWLHRVRENFQQLLAPARTFPSSANGAPIHLLRWGKPGPTGRAQSYSVLAHVAIISALALIALHPPGSKHSPLLPGDKTSPSISVSGALLDILRGHNPNGGNGSGTGHDSLPPTQGNLPPKSSIQLLKRTLPHNQHPEFPVPPTILDPSAPRVLTPVDDIGLPWMSDRNNSSGRGKGNTIGEGPNDSIGSSPGDEAGIGREPGAHQPGVTLPKCAYCPDPQYSDEAREAKLQGKVTLQVLVGADGRASQIRVVQGIGLGLDERAVQAIRGWKFIPARDATHRAVPAWVTVEAVFRLF
ncbi:MAG TPA: energy transducer TonB [Candidatus Acidoferrum sp.]|nr:energy transducer TonB [Candidatus Acidoferrum sp.]